MGHVSVLVEMLQPSVVAECDGLPINVKSDGVDRSAGSRHGNDAENTELHRIEADGPITDAPRFCFSVVYIKIKEKREKKTSSMMNLCAA
jgi:hypothetical protein